MASRYTIVTTPTQLSGLASKNSVVVIDFHATWCGPCKIIAPVFEALATKHASPGKVAFVKCDVDAAQAVAQKYGIRAMPTFIILASGTEVDRIQGADRSSLTSAVERHVRNAKPSYSGAGHKLGAPAAAAYIRNGTVSASVPAGRKVVGWLDTIVVFVALYLISLFSIDALGSAEKSRYAVGEGVGGGSSRGGGPPPPGRRLGSVDSVRGGGCQGGSCG